MHLYSTNCSMLNVFIQMAPFAIQISATMPHLLGMQTPREWNQSVATVCWPNHHWKIPLRALEARASLHDHTMTQSLRPLTAVAKKKIIHACLMPNVRIDLCGKCQAGFPALHNFFLNMIDNTWLKQCYSVPHALSWLSCYIWCERMHKGPVAE